MDLSTYLQNSQQGFFDQNLELTFSEQEKKLLEDFCELKMPKEYKCVAFSCILDIIMDNRMECMLSEKVLDFLITHEIALSDLCHMNLEDKWLIKLYDQNKNYFECMITVYRRNIVEDIKCSEFIRLVKTHLNLYAVYYVLIELSNRKELSLLQLNKILFLCRTYLPDYMFCPFMEKYVDYYSYLYDRLTRNKHGVNHNLDNNCVFHPNDFVELLRIKREL